MLPLSLAKSSAMMAAAIGNQIAGRATPTPAVRPAAASPRVRAPLSPILVVDDDPDELFLTQRLLRKTGTRHPIRAAISGSDAMGQLRKSCLAAGGKRGDKPVVVLLDVHMPLVGGFDVLRWIRRKKALRGVKVIMLSSSDELEDATRARRLGADGYLIKFPNVAIMAAALREAVQPSARRPSEAKNPVRAAPAARSTFNT